MASPLAESLAAGDREAFAALYDRLAPRLLATARTMLASTAEAEDVVHDLFVELARMRQRLTAVADLDGYVFTMLRHAASRRLPRAARRGARRGPRSGARVAPRCDAAIAPADPVPEARAGRRRIDLKRLLEEDL